MPAKLHPLMKYMRQHGLSYADVAAKIKITKGGVCHICLGRNRPSIDTAQKIAAMTKGKVGFGELYK